MHFFDWVDSGVRRFRWYDISMIKLSSAAFALFVAKLWPPLLALDWYWYLMISLVIVVPQMKKMFCGR